MVNLDFLLMIFCSAFIICLILFLAVMKSYALLYLALTIISGILILLIISIKFAFYLYYRRDSNQKNQKQHYITDYFYEDDGRINRRTKYLMINQKDE